MNEDLTRTKLKVYHLMYLLYVVVFYSSSFQSMKRSKINIGTTTTNDDSEY